MSTGLMASISATVRCVRGCSNEDFVASVTAAAAGDERRAPKGAAAAASAAEEEPSKRRREIETDMKIIRRAGESAE